MKKVFIVFILFCMSLPANAVYLTIPKDTTTILLTINEPVTSKKVKAGSVLDATISENVYINKQLIFKEGTPAKVNVTKVKKATIMGVAGEIVLENGRVKDINGDNHIITFGYKFQGNVKLYPKVFTAVGIIV